MDIFEYAESIGWLADYYDFHTGLTYHIQDYKRDLDKGLMPSGILVTRDGEIVGEVCDTRGK